jgi:hypothetical protein
MSQLRKREHRSETGAAAAVMVIIRNNIRLRLKVEKKNGGAIPGETALRGRSASR